MGSKVRVRVRVEEQKEQQETAGSSKVYGEAAASRRPARQAEGLIEETRKTRIAKTELGCCFSFAQAGGTRKRAGEQSKEQRAMEQGSRGQGSREQEAVEQGSRGAGSRWQGSKEQTAGSRLFILILLIDVQHCFSYIIFIFLFWPPNE